MSTVNDLGRGTVEAVVCDLDGLLLDTERLYKRAWQRAAKEKGYELDDELYAQLVGHSRSACDEKLVAALGPLFPLAEFHAAWAVVWKRFIEDEAVLLKPGALELLTMLHEHRTPVALATSSSREFANLSLRSAHLHERFDIVVTGDDVSRSKPAPDIYLEAAKRLGVAPRRCIALEDTAVGAEAARNAGMMAILVPDMYEPQQASGVIVVRSLSEAAVALASSLCGTS